MRPLQMVMPGMESMMGSLVSTLVADVAATGDDFVYGAVDAPGAWPERKGGREGAEGG